MLNQNNVHHNLWIYEIKVKMRLNMKKENENYTEILRVVNIIHLIYTSHSFIRSLIHGILPHTNASLNIIQALNSKYITFTTWFTFLPPCVLYLFGFFNPRNLSSELSSRSAILIHRKPFWHIKRSLIGGDHLVPPLWRHDGQLRPCADSIALCGK